MSDLPEPLFHIDYPNNWVPTTPEMEIRGWLSLSENSVCLDLRARIDDKIYLGNYGLDLPNIDSRTGEPEAPAGKCGFTQQVTFWRGAKELTLEYHNGREWREFFKKTLDTSHLPANAARPKPILRAAVVYQTLHCLYRYHHISSWSTLCREADAALAEILLPTSDVVHHADLPGFIENPGYWINAGYNKFRVTGWTFPIEQTISNLTATTGVGVENRLVYPKDRPDVAAHRTDHSNALHSGYYGLVDINPETPSPVNLKIFAKNEAGQRRLAFSRRLYLDRQDEHSGPVTVYRPHYFYKVVAALFRGFLLGRFTFDSWKTARSEVTRLQQHLASTLGRDVTPSVPQAIIRRRDQDPYTRWRWHNRLTTQLRQVLQDDAKSLVATENSPLISIVVPAYNTPENFLHELLDSVRCQIYPRWELCIADDASTEPHVRRILEKAAKADPRIKPVFRSQNGHISHATNSALDRATGEYVALLDHDDTLPHDSLLHIAETICRHPSADYLYTDEDKIDESGHHFDPQFKGGWSPEMAITHNYTHHLTVIRRRIVDQVGRLRPEFNGAQDIDLFLRCWEQIRPEDIKHVPFIGYHWRAHAESTASRGDQKGYLFEAARNAISEALKRRGLRATPTLPPIAQDYALCLHQLKWSPSLLKENPVTIVIPTKNRVDLLKKCLDSLIRTIPIDTVKIIVVNDRSDDPESIRYLAALPHRTDLRCSVINTPDDAQAKQFNYSRLVNLGSSAADTPLILHLNNDVEALYSGWLEDMVGWLSVSGVGIVGAKLLYPDGTINHAGISLSREDGLAHVLFEHESADSLGYLFLPHAARNVAAVTGACLLTTTKLYRQLNGFDEDKLAVAYNDVDFCLRAQAEGYRTVYTPQAVLQHVGSASRGSSYAIREHIEYIARHGKYRDPYHSEALKFPPHNLPINPYDQRYARTSRPFNILLITHNLKFEGAPIFLFELARFLSEQPELTASIVSPEDGPLRTRYEAEGLKVEIWDISPLSKAKSPADFDQGLKYIAKANPCLNADLIVGNTLLAYWGIHLASHLKKPSLLYVHESKAVNRFFADILPTTLHPTVEKTLSLATRVIFTAQATRKIFEEHNGNDNFRTLPSWVDFDRIEQFVATHDKAALRRKHGLDPEAVVIANIGSICERKGQHIYIRSLDLLKEKLPVLFPGKNIQWTMVGARPGLYMETLLEDIKLMNLPELIVFNETSEIYDFYHLADILVCTSFEESFPRVLLEAMAFGTRIVSTDVDGISEMLTHTDEAYLVPAGDPHKLAEALQGALSDHFKGNQKMIAMATARATRNYHQARALPLHLLSIREAWLG